MDITFTKMSEVLVKFIHGFLGLIVLISAESYGYKLTEFSSVPTTVKTVENDTVLLPCSHNGEIFNS